MVLVVAMVSGGAMWWRWCVMYLGGWCCVVWCLDVFWGWFVGVVFALMCGVLRFMWWVAGDLIHVCGA